MYPPYTPGIFSLPFGHLPTDIYSNRGMLCHFPVLGRLDQTERSGGMSMARSNVLTIRNGSSRSSGTTRPDRHVPAKVRDDIAVNVS